MHQYLIPAVLLLTLPVHELSLSLEIPCQARLEPGVQYSKIFWYKVTEHNSVEGLVMKDLLNNTTNLYKNAKHLYQIGDDFSLVFMPESMEKGCETYRCSLWPSVGHRIQESDYSFPQGCQKSDEIMPMFAIQSMDMHSGPLFRTYVFVTVGALLVVLAAVSVVLVFTLFNKQRQKYTKVPV